MSTDASLHLETERAQVRRDERRSARFLSGELGVLMNIAPPRDDPGQDFAYASLDLGANRWVGGLRGEQRGKSGEEEEWAHGWK